MNYSSSSRKKAILFLLFHLSTEALCAGVHACRLMLDLLSPAVQPEGSCHQVFNRGELKNCCTSGDKYPFEQK